MHRNYATSSRNYTLQTDLMMFSSTYYLLDFVLNFKYRLEWKRGSQNCLECLFNFDGLFYALFRVWVLCNVPLLIKRAKVRIMVWAGAFTVLDKIFSPSCELDCLQGFRPLVLEIYFLHSFGYYACMHKFLGTVKLCSETWLEFYKFLCPLDATIVFLEQRGNHMFTSPVYKTSVVGPPGRGVSRTLDHWEGSDGSLH
jgi:hypothetical protein